MALVLAATGVAWWQARSAGQPRAGEAESGTHADAGSRGGVLIASVRGEPRSFNRYVVPDATSDLVSSLLHARLVRINKATQEAEPWLAESVAPSADGLAYTVRLRPGVTFSDGEPFGADDVAFSFEAVYDERTGSPLADALAVDGKPLQVEVVDSHTLTIRFPAPFGPGLRMLDSLPILPRHRLEGELRAGRFRDAWSLTTAPGELAGLGPFVLTEYVPGDRLVLSRNPRYWRTDPEGRPLPYIDRLVLSVVPDQNTEVLRLQAGELDLLSSEIRPDDYALVRQLAEEGRLRFIDLGVGLDPSFLWFNLDPAAHGDDPRRSWLQSRALRKAISHAVDRQAFANAVFFGAAAPVSGPITPANRIWYSDRVPADATDEGRARRLLADAGLEDRDGDGVAEDVVGRPARFSLLTQKGHTTRERGAAVLQEELRRLGLVVDVVALELGALIERVMSGRYDAAYFQILASDTDPAVNLDFWLSSGSFHVWHPGQPQPATPWEGEIDRLMMEHVRATDTAVRQAIFERVQTIFANEAPAIYFAAPRVMIAMSHRVGDATPVVLRPQVLWNAEALTVAPTPLTERRDRR